jgi:hypothetical protein
VLAFISPDAWAAGYVGGEPRHITVHQNGKSSSANSSAGAAGAGVRSRCGASSLRFTLKDSAGAFALASGLRFHALTQYSTPSTSSFPVKSGWVSFSFLSFFQIEPRLVLS